MLHVEHNLGDAPSEVHYHNTHEVIFVVRGEIRLTLHDQSMDVPEGSLVFLSNLEEHAVSVLREPYERYFFTLSAQSADQWIRDPALLSILKLRPPGFQNAVAVGPIAGQVQQLFEALLHESTTAQPYAQESMRSLLVCLMVLLYRHAPGAFPFDPHTSKAAHAAQRYIDQHFTEPLAIPEVAERFFISPSYLTHQFKRLTGYSPKQYIMLSRLAMAHDLLRQGMPVEEAARRSGFSDINNFIRKFRARYDITPGVARRESQAKE